MMKLESIGNRIMGLREEGRNKGNWKVRVEKKGRILGCGKWGKRQVVNNFR
jgi:hypothetical protein